MRPPPALKGLHSLLLLQLQQPQPPLEGAERVQLVENPSRIPCRAQGWTHSQNIRRVGALPRWPWGGEGAEHPWGAAGCGPCAPGDVTNVPRDGDRVLLRDLLPGHPVGCVARSRKCPSGPARR